MNDMKPTHPQVVVPRSFGQLVNATEDKLVFEAQDGTIRVVILNTTAQYQLQHVVTRA